MSRKRQGRVCLRCVCGVSAVCLGCVCRLVEDDDALALHRARDELRDLRVEEVPVVTAAGGEVRLRTGPLPASRLAHW